MADLHFAGMQTGADLDAQRPDPPGNGPGASDGPGGPIESGKKAVPGGVNLGPAEAVEFLSHDSVMAGLELTPPLITE